MSEISELLKAINAGDQTAKERLMPLVYDEMRSLAARNLAKERPGQTLQATALVHEAYIRLWWATPMRLAGIAVVTSFRLPLSLSAES